MQKKLVPHVISECRCTTCAPEKTVQEAAVLMTEENIGALIVVEGERVVGIVTERDIMRKVVGGGLDAAETKVADIMTKNPDTVTGDCLAATALNMMVEKGYRHLPLLTDDGKPCGMVSVRDLYRVVQTALQEELVAVENYVHGGEGYGVGA